MDNQIVRKQMVEQQVRTWDVFDPEVLNTIAAVPRDRFVPGALMDCAYADIEIPLGHGQCMLRPSIAGRILQALDIHAGDDVLEIGTGSGYLTACIARLAAAVTSVDLYADFIASAGERLDDLDVGNVSLRAMDASIELPAGAFDAIAVTAALHQLDERFVNALKPGGRLFVVTGESPAMVANLVTRGPDGAAAIEELFETDIPALIRAEAPRKFMF